MEMNGREAVESRFDFFDPLIKKNIEITYQLVNTLNYIKLNTLPKKYLDEYLNFINQASFVEIKKGNDPKKTGHYRAKFFEHKDLKNYPNEPTRITVFWDPVQVKRTVNGKVTKFTPQTGITTKIYYPNRALLGRFMPFYQATVVPKISKDEVTFDFYSDDPNKLFSFITHHIYMKYSRYRPLRYKNTFYLIKTERGKRYSKLMRVYIKREISGRPVRMELVLNRPAINGKFDLSSLDQQLKNLDLSKYFAFRFVDREKFLAVLFEQERKNRKKNPRQFTDENSERRYKKWSFDLYCATLKSATEFYFFDWLPAEINIDTNGIIDEIDQKNQEIPPVQEYLEFEQNENNYAFQQRAVADINHKMKLIKQKAYKDIKKLPSNLLSDMPEVNKQFFDIIRGRSFL